MDLVSEMKYKDKWNTSIQIALEMPSTSPHALYIKMNLDTLHFGTCTKVNSI